MAIMRIRATSGEFSGKWLWLMEVSKGGLKVPQPNWDAILTGPTRELQFHPTFIDSKEGGFSPISKEMGEAVVRILKSLAIEAELVTENLETPDWIKKDRDAAAETARREADETERTTAEGLSISKVAPDFWRTLVEQLKINTDALEPNYTRSTDERIVGHTIPEYDTTHTPDWSCDIRVERYSVKFGPVDSKLRLYFRPGTTTIRRVPNFHVDKQDEVDLVMQRTEVGVEVAGRVLAAKRFAEETVRRLFDQVNFPDSQQVP